MNTRGIVQRVLVTLPLALLGAAAARSGLTSPAPDTHAPLSAAAEAAPAVHRTLLADSVAQMIAQRIAGPAPAEVSSGRWNRVRSLYTARAGVPLWFMLDDGGRRASDFLQALAAAHEDGLRPPFPMRPLRDALSSAQGTAPPTSALAAADVLLTSAFVAFGEDLLLGQHEPGSAGQSWHIARAEPVDSLLAAALRMESVDLAIASLRPTNRDYAALRLALARYRRIVATGGWPAISRGSTLSPGDTSTAERLEAIVRRLAAEGHVDAGASRRGADERGAPVYDAVLAAAVAAFQRKHGLAVDSVVGPRTLEALNVPALTRLEQIVANLERHRWLPRETAGPHILVNAAAFRLQAFTGDREALTSRVIVGAPSDGRATPSFDAVARAVIFRPYWNVPDRIAANELWPRARRDAGYLARHRYEVVSRDGVRRLRQLPGPENALGLMKIDMPNRFDVYLHDTPTKELFCEDVRAFSHGCIRLERPAAVAEWLLGWDAERVRWAMEYGRDDSRVALARPVPVRIAYLTVFVEDDEVRFGKDVYRRDPALMRLVRDGVTAHPVSQER